MHKQSKYNHIHCAAVQHDFVRNNLKKNQWLVLLAWLREKKNICTDVAVQPVEIDESRAKITLNLQLNKSDWYKY